MMKSQAHRSLAALAEQTFQDAVLDGLTLEEACLEALITVDRAEGLDRPAAREEGLGAFDCALRDGAEPDQALFDALRALQDD